MPRRSLRPHLFQLLCLFGAVFAISFVLTSRFPHTEASVAGFNPGNIMSDYVMGNYSTMTEADIQNFLKSKNSCNDTRIYLANYYPNMKYHIENGHFVCMADEVFDGETAAHIIWQAAQDYRINPQVLLVLLEKEQGLLTDTWPNHIQYRSATGFGCPDTAACDSQYYGLKNQVRNAANLFRKVLDGGWTNYPVGWNYIQYNPASHCGGSNVYIENRATSALYRYTPYQPNAGALAAHPGTAHCGAYGNRNFYSFFRSWFGSPIVQKPALPYESPNFIDLDGSEYRIATALDRYHFIDISGASFADGTIVQLYAKWSETNKAQIWTFEPAGERQYYIKSALTQKYLSIDEAKNGAQTLQQSKTNSCEQKWMVADHGDNVVIHSACNKNFVLDVSAAKSFSGARTQVYERWSLSNPAQEWQLEKVLPAKKQLIQDGSYKISTALDKKKYLDVYGGYIADYTKIQLYESWSADNKAQIWNIKHQGDNIYTISSVISGRLLTIHQTRNGAAAVTFSKELVGCGQLWLADQTEYGIRFHSFCNNNYVLDVSGGNAQNGVQVQIFQEWAKINKAQDWLLEPILSQLIQNGTYRISTALNPKQFLDVWGASMEENAKIQLYENWYDLNKAQLWNIQHRGGDVYVIKSVLSGKVLTASSIQNLQQITLADFGEGQCSQLWKANEQDGFIVFMNLCNPKYALDVFGGIATNQSKIQLYERWAINNLAQKWKLSPR